MSPRVPFPTLSMILLTSVLLHSACSQKDDEDVLCPINSCPNGEMCLKRDGPGNITFICACENPRQAGFNCVSGFFPHNRREDCYGRTCESGSFSSPNYPSNYDERDYVLMSLFIPHAVAIHFEFSSPFRIEEGKDELYVGSGLVITYDDITMTPLKDGLLYFDGETPVPNNFTLETDTALIFFASDRSTTFAGFNISWTSTVDYTPPTILSCPEDEAFFIRKNESGKHLQLKEPAVFDPDGQDTFTQVSAPEGNIFPVGSTRVTHRYADVYDNAVVCEYNITVTVDDIPPQFLDCPDNMFFNLTYPNTTVNVNWIEPSVTDNSGEILSSTGTNDPGDSFVNGTTLVEYSASDGYGNEGYCRFVVIVSIDDGDPPDGSLLNVLLPVLICGLLFTIISCICCLGRSTKVRSSSSKATSSKSDKVNNLSSDGRKRSGAKISVSSLNTFENQGLSQSTSESAITASSAGSSDARGNVAGIRGLSSGTKSENRGQISSTSESIISDESRSSDSSGYVTAGKIVEASNLNDETVISFSYSSDEIEGTTL